MQMRGSEAMHAETLFDCVYYNNVLQDYQQYI